jgi:hypothetical protein
MDSKKKAGAIPRPFSIRGIQSKQLSGRWFTKLFPGVRKVFEMCVDLDGRKEYPSAIS